MPFAGDIALPRNVLTTCSTIDADHIRGFRRWLAVFKKIFLPNVIGPARISPRALFLCLRSANSETLCVANGGMRKAGFRPLSRSFLLALVFLVSPVFIVVRVALIGMVVPICLIRVVVGVVLIRIGIHLLLCVGVPGYTVSFAHVICLL